VSQPLAAVSDGACRPRFDPFRVLSDAERRRHLDAYRSYLEARNGALDLRSRTLSRREQEFRELETLPVTWSGAVDREGFAERFLGTGRRAIDARTLWLVAVAKANQGESYGVDLELTRYLARGIPAGDDLIQPYLFLEEQYHSRILVEACRTCGIEMTLRPPPRLMRAIIHAIYALPDRFRWTLVLCGEVLGSTVFKLILEHCSLFSEQPAVETRLRSLIGQIWRDEVLHVAWLRARLGPWALATARRLMPSVVAGLMRDVPQLVELGCDGAELMRRLAGGIELPPGLGWIELEPADPS
jgi:hypothetical protein